MFSSWLAVHRHFINDPRFNQEIATKFSSSVAEHAEVLAEICPIFWPKADHNHYLMENLGLLAAAFMCSPDSRSFLWRDHAIRELERCAQVQLSDDGGQIEGCPTYHNGCISWFCQALQLSGDRMSSGFRDRLRRGLIYSVHSFRPTGTCVPAGDSDAVDVATPAAILWYQSNGDPEPLFALTGLIGPERALAVVCAHVWEIDDPEALLNLVNAPSKQCSMPLANHQQELNQVMLRTSWNREALSLFFACRSPVGHGGGHAHIDPCGFDFTALGKPLLVDPGRYTYRQDNDRRLFKSAPWHNTVTVDDRDPYAYTSGWSYGLQREGRITGMWETSGILSAAAFQRNFAPALHRRLVALVDSAFLVIIDAFSGLMDGSTVQLHYHFDSTQVTWNQEEHLYCSIHGDVKMEMATSPSLRGWLWPAKVSELYDEYHPSLRARLEDSSNMPNRVLATIAVPSPLESSPSFPKVEGAEEVDGSILCKVTVRGHLHTLHWGKQGLTRLK
jgi:hypothetical protein